MQLTHLQVERSLEALHELQIPDVDVDSLPTDRTIPAGVMEALAGSPAVREERLVDARLRLVGGEQPSDDDLAERLVGRLVCDRLR